MRWEGQTTEEEEEDVIDYVSNESPVAKHENLAGQGHLLYSKGSNSSAKKYENKQPR